MNNQQNNSYKHSQSDEIDLRQLFGTLFQRKVLIVACAAIFTAFGVCYAILTPPIYKADALIQIEEKSSGIKGLGEMGEMFASESNSSTEIALIKSRMVLGQTVDDLNLTTIVTPDVWPIIGAGLNRLSSNPMTADIKRFTADIGSYVLTIKDAENRIYELSNGKGVVLLSGQVGRQERNDSITIEISQLTGSTGDKFFVCKIPRINAIQQLKGSLMVGEEGKSTGMLTLSIEGTDREKITEILQSVSDHYISQNILRGSQEAQNSLDFLSNQLPEIRNSLIIYENKLNDFRKASRSVDLGLEAKATLDTMVSIETQLNELTFRESEISQRFTKDHPAYMSLMDKRNTLINERSHLDDQVKKLPDTQKQILILTRDVAVNQEIYVTMLNKIQELRVMKASIVGNVRSVDPAMASDTAVKPKKSLIVILSFMLGSMLGVMIALVLSFMKKGIRTSDELDVIGLPVYATVPLSDWDSKKGPLLAKCDPADLSIEALRSLRTSLHFAMLNAKNNIIMITGASPNIGKTFVSSNLASLVATSGKKVIVIDTDTRKGTLHDYFDDKNEQGLSGYLSGVCRLDDIVRNSANLDYITRGDVPPNPSELLMHERFTELLKDVSSRYDVVILDTPPVLPVTDTCIIGASVGTVLFVGRFEQTTMHEIETSKSRLEQAGIMVNGFILNGVPHKCSGYGYYNYNYEYKAV